MKRPFFAALILILPVLAVLLAAHRPASAQLPPLRQMAVINLGAAVEPRYLQTEPVYAQTFAREFNTLIPENALKFGSLSSGRGQYNFAEADFLVDYAAANGMKVRGHTLVWHEQLPDWFKYGTFSREDSIAILREHIAAVAGRYRGRIAEWDVLNEAVDDWNGGLRQTIWLQRIGPEYIDLAFQAAHEADPNALLYYNDYSNEGLGGKSDAVYNLVKGLLERGVPVHGVGFQLHTSLAWRPNPQDVAANMARYAALGLRVQITEMDVRTQDVGGEMADKLAAQAQVYREMLDVCLAAPNCDGLNTWGFTDKYSWIPWFTGKPDAALIYDENYRPKPAYHALAERLAQPADPTPAPTPIPPTLTPPPAPTGPTLVVDAQPADGNAVRVDFRLYRVENLYGLQVDCQVDPAVLAGMGRADGEGFNQGNSFFVDKGFDAATGKWLVGAGRKRPAPPITGDALAFTLAYRVLSAENSAVVCSALAADPAGRLLPLEVINGAYTAPTPEPPPPTPTEIPLLPTPTQPPAPSGTISGSAAYQNRPDNAGIVVELLAQGAAVAQVITGADGSYRFEGLPAGSYTLRADAPLHLAAVQEVTIAEQPVDMGRLLLLAGDTDDSGIIDLLDAGFIGANFDLAAPPAPANADLNGDGQVNISDLVLVGANFGVSQPGR